MKENLLAASAGGAVGVLVNMGQEIFTTLFLGMVGALGGLLMKEIWNLLKQKLWQKRK